MMWIFPFILMMAPTVLGEDIQTNISAAAGSTFSLPGSEACRHPQTKFLSELSMGQDMIGWYDGKLNPRGRFQGRLAFDERRCAFTLRNLSLEDGGVYTITERYVEEGRLQADQKTFHITVLDHVTSAPLPTDMVTNSTPTACDLGFSAVCISLAPTINGLIDVIYLHSCWLSYVTQRCRDIVLWICGFVSLGCQLFVISFWLSCGMWNSLLCFVLAICFMAILIAFRILPLCKCVNIVRLGKKVRCGLMPIFFLLQLGFTACVVTAFSTTHGQIIVQKIWVPITFCLSYLVVFTLPGIVGKVYHSYFCPRTPEKAEDTEMEKMKPTENDFSIKQAEKSSPFPV